MAFSGLLRFWRGYRNIARIRQIVNVFLKHGFGQFIEQINLQRFIPLRKRIRVFGQWKEPEKFTIPERLRIAFSELGPSFIKLAQILSSRPDIITSEYADEFRKLQDDVPPFPAEEARAMIESELKRSIGKIFADFEDEPFAAASIAQVHNATLISGEKVVVKVQRPGIHKTIETDISILRIIARLMVRHIPEASFLNPEGIVDEFAKTVTKELDFIGETRNAQRFRRNFADSKIVYIPLVYTDFVTEKILVMERIEGVKIDDIKAIDTLSIDRPKLAKNGLNIYFKMIFEDGFFHADPHPGNMFVFPDGRLGLMDFGMTGRLTPEMMESIANTFLAFFNKDFDRLIDEYIELGLLSDGVDQDIFRKKFKSDLVDLLEPVYGLTISEINFIDYMEKVTRLAIKHGLTIPSDLILVNKTVLMLDNIGRQLDPDFNFIAAAEPYAAKLVKSRINPQRIFDKAKDNISEISNLLIDTPRQINRLLAKALKNEISLKVDPIGIDRLIRDIDRSSNRLAFSVIVASIIIGSSLLIQSGIGTTIFGLPAIGAIGFFIAFLLGLWLLISILKSGRL
ncbi:MAG: AarF/ABC1/UbiB kinase family protein [Thermodesulfovibrionia bacterium]|nr:AarF/ABC1/UbiB kinase family protein [Thermodesulfovibrionia bacterium]